MLRLTLRQFLGLSMMVENKIMDNKIPPDLFQYIDLCIGDPAADGDITVDYVGPKSLINDYFKDE